MTPLTHKPTDELLAKSLDVAGKIRDTELSVESLRRELDGTDGPRYTPGLDVEVIEMGERVKKMEDELLRAKQWLASKLQRQVEVNTQIAEGERALAQLHREYADLLASALKSFPV